MVTSVSDYKGIAQEVSHLIELFNGSNPHASSISPTTTPEAITQLKKQNTSNTRTKERNSGNTES